MSLSKQLRKFLYEPKIRDLDVDAQDILATHRSLLKSKPMLCDTFRYFYKKMVTLCDQYLNVDGREIELGSGVGFMKDVRPTLETSDIRKLDSIDLIIDAQNMNLLDNSVRCIYAINVFHHLAEPEKFFEELKRVLVPGGGCILIEPHGGPASAALHKRLHKDEFFDTSMQRDWVNKEIRGPLSGANQALSHIVFERDIIRFQRDHGDALELIHRGYCTNALRYFFSGGLNFRQLMPTVASSVLRAIETIATPAAYYWSFHQILVIKRR